MAQTDYCVKKVEFRLFLTGKGEQKFISAWLGQIVKDQNDLWNEKGGQVVEFDKNPEFIGQHSPTSENLKPLRITGTHRKIPTALEVKVTLPVSMFLRAKNTGTERFVLLIDDLESSHLDMALEKFRNYRAALDKALDTEELRARASVHFFINMLEAYYFTHPDVVNDVLKTNLTEPIDDVEAITHPKNDLDKLIKSIDPNSKFKEITHGEQILNRLDLERILSNPTTCRALRTLVGWCRHRLGAPFDQRWRLADGEFHPLTRDQIPWPPPSSTPNQI